MVCDFKEELLLVTSEVPLESQPTQPVLTPRPLHFAVRSHRHSSWKGLALMCTQCPCSRSAPREGSTSRIHEHAVAGVWLLYRWGLQSHPGRGSGHFLGHTMLVPLHLASLGNEEN